MQRILKKFLSVGVDYGGKGASDDLGTTNGILRYDFNQIFGQSNTKADIFNKPKKRSVNKIYFYIASTNLKARVL